MTDKEISKLRRSELLEILYSLRKEIDLLEEENKSLKMELEEIKYKDSIFNEILEVAKETNTIVKANNVNSISEKESSDKITSEAVKTNDKL